MAPRRLTAQMIAEAIGRIPAAFVEWLDRLVQRKHGPFDLWGDGSEAICLICEVPWPCDPFTEVTDRIDARHLDRVTPGA